MLTTIHVLLSLHITSHNVCFYIHHRKMDTPHIVCSDVCSYYPSDWIIYNIPEHCELCQSTMHILMLSLQSTILAEWLITYITRKWMLPSMKCWCFLTSNFQLNDLLHISQEYHCSLLCTCVCDFRSPLWLNDYHTHQRNVHTPCYICVDISPYYYCDWLIYYMYHMNMAAPQMHVHMILQKILVTEWFITHTRGI
jgi:hypothetical protein